MAFHFFWLKKAKTVIRLCIQFRRGTIASHHPLFSLSCLQYVNIYLYIGLTCNQYAAARQGISFSRAQPPEEVSPPTHYMQPTPECQHPFPVSIFLEKRRSTVNDSYFNLRSFETFILSLSFFFERWPTASLNFLVRLVVLSKQRF